MPGRLDWFRRKLRKLEPLPPETPASLPEPSLEVLFGKPVSHPATPAVIAPAPAPPRVPPAAQAPAPAPSVVYQHIVSLGSDCDAAMQLRRVGWLQTPSVFDWLVTPWESMLAVLHDRGARLAQKFYLSHDGQGAACGAYDLVYWHEFPRDGAGKVQITEAAAAQARAKLAHKMARLHETLSGTDSVLLLRSGIITDAPKDRFAAGSPFGSAELDRCAALITKLYPNLRFSLLCIDYPGRDPVDRAPARDPRVIRYRMPLPPAGTPEGLSKATDAEWDKLFTKIRYEPHASSVQVEENLSD